MQTITINEAFINSNECTFEMLLEVATHKDYGAISLQDFEKLAAKPNGKKDTLPNSMLRKELIKILKHAETQSAAFNEGNMQFEMQHLPDPLAALATNKASGRKETVALKGAYKVVNCNALKCTEATDPGKFSIWKHVWACNTFEQYFAVAPKKATTNTGRLITASSEIRWAVQRGWIAMVQEVPPATDAPQQEQPVAPAATDAPQQEQPAA